MISKTTVQPKQIIQDDQRERGQISFFGLIHGSLIAGNKAREGFDATDIKGRIYEMKTSTNLAMDYSTSARLNRAYVEKNLSRYWVTSWKAKFVSGVFSAEEHWLLTPRRLRVFWNGWLEHFALTERENDLALRLMSHAGDASLFEAEIAEIDALNADLVKRKLRKKKRNSKPFLERMADRLILGSSENDPKLSGKYIREYGVQIFDAKSLADEIAKDEALDAIERALGGSK